MDNRLSRWWHANAPTRESLEHNRFLAPVAHRVLERLELGEKNLGA